MFGVTWHDIISGMMSNGAWAVVLFLLAVSARRISASIKSAGVGRTATRGLWSALLLSLAGGSLAFAFYTYHSRGFVNGVWFVVYSFNCWTNLRAFTSFNRNWLSPALKKLVDGISHIFEIAHPDHKPGLPASAPDVRALIEQMDETIDTYEATKAIVSIVSIGQDAVEPLIEALHHRRMWVRANAAVALGHIKDERAIAPLMDCLADGHDVTQQLTAATALGRIGRPALSLLAEAARSSDDEIREGGIRALGRCRDIEAIELLQEIMGEWRENTARAGKDLFRDADGLLQQHRQFFYTDLTGEERSAENSRLLTDSQALRARSDEYFEFSKWRTPVHIVRAAAVVATAAEADLKRLEEKQAA